MNVHQVFTQLAEYGDVYAPSVHPGNAATITPDLTPQGEPSTPLKQRLTFQDLPDGLACLIRYLKSSFNQSFFHPRPDHGCISPAAHDGFDRIDDDRFTGPCLAGENIQPAVKLQLQLTDDGEIFDVEFT